MLVPLSAVLNIHFAVLSLLVSGLFGISEANVLKSFFSTRKNSELVAARTTCGHNEWLFTTFELCLTIGGPSGRHSPPSGISCPSRMYLILHFCQCSRSNPRVVLAYAASVSEVDNFIHRNCNWSFQDLRARTPWLQEPRMPQRLVLARRRLLLQQESRGPRKYLPW